MHFKLKCVHFEEKKSCFGQTMYCKWHYAQRNDCSYYVKFEPIYKTDWITTIVVFVRSLSSLLSAGSVVCRIPSEWCTGVHILEAPLTAAYYSDQICYYLRLNWVTGAFLRYFGHSCINQQKSLLTEIKLNVSKFRSQSRGFWETPVEVWICEVYQVSASLAVNSFSEFTRADELQ